MGLPKPSKPDGTEGTATCEMTYKEEGKLLTHTVYGCIVKNDANLQGFIKGHEKQSADLVKFEKTNYFFYTCDPGFKEQTSLKTKVTCHCYNQSKPISFTLDNLPPGNIVKIEEHIFLLCDSQEFNANKFLKDYHKSILRDQDLNQKAEILIHGLSEEKECLKFIPLKLCHHSSNVYDVDAKSHENYEKLIQTGPALLPEDSKTRTVIGRFEKTGAKKIYISIFRNNQVADESASESASGVDNVVTEEQHNETDERAASSKVEDTSDSPAINQQSTGHQSDDVNSLMAATSIKEPKNNSIPSNGEHGKPVYHSVTDEPDAGGIQRSDSPAEIAKPKLGKTFGDLSDENQESLLLEIEAEKKQLKSSIEIPSGDERQKYEIRKLTQLLRKNKMTNTIKWMKSNLERGITGPYLDENTNVSDMPYPVRRDLTHALSANNDHWKTLADYLGFSNVELQFADNRFTNPAEVILKKWETKRDASVGNLYDILVLLDMPIIADSGI